MTKLYKDFIKNINNRILESKNIELNIFSNEHITNDYISWFNDKEVCAFNSHGDSLYTLEMAKKYLAYVDQLNDYFVFAIIDKKNKKHIGNITLYNINWNYKIAEISIIIGDKSYWGKGFAKESILLLLEFVFSNLTFHRIYMGVVANHQQMNNLARGINMTCEGVLRKAFLKNDIYSDINFYGILRGEYSNV